MVEICHGCVWNPPPIGDAGLAREVIEAYADEDGLEEFGDRVPLEIYGDAGTLLINVLAVEDGPYSVENGFPAIPPAVTPEEQQKMLEFGFTREFVEELSGPDGLRPFQARTRWFYKNLDWVRAQTVEKQKTLIRQAVRTDPDEFSRPFLLSSLCFGQGTDLGGMLVQWMKGSEEEQSCTAAALRAMLSTDFIIPSTATPLIHSVVEYFSGNEEYQALAVELLGHLETPTEEAINFLEGLLREGRFLTMQAPLVTLMKFGKELVPAVIRLLGLPRLDSFLLAQHLLKVGVERNQLPALVEVMALNENKNINGEYDQIAPFAFLAKVVGEMGGGIDDDLIQLYREGDSRVKLTALSLLVRDEKPNLRALPLCIDALDSDNPALVAKARFLLANQGALNFSLPLLLEAFDHERRGVRTEAVSVLKSMLDTILFRNQPENTFKPYRLSFYPLTKSQLSQVVWKFSEKLVSDDPQVRKIAAEALALLKIHARNALPILVAMKERDLDESCRVAAAQAVAKIEEEVL